MGKIARIYLVAEVGEYLVFVDWVIKVIAYFHSILSCLFYFIFINAFFCFYIFLIVLFYFLYFFNSFIFFFIVLFFYFIFPVLYVV